MNTDRHIASSLVVAALLIFSLAGSARAEDWKLLFDLRGQWKFEIGDDSRRAEPGFNDSKWESIHAPSAWEDQGFPGYDGYAWYRKHFTSSTDWTKKNLALHLGNIDDVDEVFLNGHKVGSTGSFPPGFSTAYTVERIYPFSPSFLSPAGDNVVAVRVYDQQLSGGILYGRLGVFENVDPLRIEQIFQSDWKFRTGDNPDWKEEHFDDSKWESIKVPSFWESEGYPDYDGFAWYRARFILPTDLLDKQIILVLGKIDDFDITYLNGHEIGHTGNMATRLHDIPGSTAYQQLRAYVVPIEFLDQNGQNVVAVRVYDGYKDGGMYAGPLGLVTRQDYLKWQRHEHPASNFFDWLFNHQPR